MWIAGVSYPARKDLVVMLFFLCLFLPASVVHSVICRLNWNLDSDVVTTSSACAVMLRAGLETKSAFRYSLSLFVTRL